MDNKKEWFEDWFNSPYYHILYDNRDMKEAEFFLNNLIHKFSPGEDSKIIDLACGKGRHSIYLNSLGFHVTGLDLSECSIAEAKPFENEKLHFLVGDLRKLNLKEKFDIALNLFTSFAYFDDLETDEQVLNEIKGIVKPGGFLLIDFFNIHTVSKALVPQQRVEKDGVIFDIRKSVQGNKIIKNICFTDKGKNYQYQEKVQALSLEDFQNLLSKTGFTFLEVFGSYDLSPYEADKSERLIMIARNKQDG